MTTLTLPPPPAPSRTEHRRQRGAAMKDTKHPIDKKTFERWSARIQDRNFMNAIPAIMEMQARILLEAYHGGFVRSAWSILKGGIGRKARHIYWLSIYRFCDKIGWTRLQQIPDTAFFERHSAKCDKMNCNDVDCIQSGIPRWFQRLTRMEKFL